MLIQYASDLHLELMDNRQLMALGFLPPKAECLVLAGDIAPLLRLKQYDFFWDWCSKHFEQTIFVPGNHDFYGGWPNRQALNQPICLAIRPNVVCCNNMVFKWRNIDFVCSTLWSSIDPVQEAALVRTLRDFFAIRIGQNKNKLTASDYQWLHECALQFIRTAVQASKADKKVVVTHHLPSYAVLASCFRHSPLNSGFVTELGSWIGDSSIDVWIYGHSHVSIETSIGKTRLLSNQLGYVALGETESYWPGKTAAL